MWCRAVRYDRFMINLLFGTTQQKREAPRSFPTSALHQPTRRQVAADNLHSRPSHILTAHTIYILIYSRCRRLFSQSQFNVLHVNERRCRCHDRHHVRSERSLKRRDRPWHGDPHTGACTRRRKTRPSVVLEIHYNEDHDNHVWKCWCKKYRFTKWKRICEEFYVYGTMHRWSTSIIVQRDATQSSIFIILQVHSTCFGCQTQPSSWVHKTVTTASGTRHIFCAAASLQRGQAWPRWREVAAQYRKL